MLCDCVTVCVGGGRCVEILAFVFFFGKVVGCLGLLFRTDKTI